MPELHVTSCSWKVGITLRYWNEENVKIIFKNYHCRDVTADALTLLQPGRQILLNIAEVVPKHSPRLQLWVVCNYMGLEYCSLGIILQYCAHTGGKTVSM